MANKDYKNLPNELWEFIFNKLHHSHLEPLSLTCKRFLSLTNALRTHLTIIEPSHFPFSTLLNRFPNLDSLDLSCFCNQDIFNRNKIDDRMPNLNLEALDLQRMIMDIANSNLSNLESLNFSGTELHLESLRILGSRMRNLKVLKCSKLRTLCNLDLVVIANSMPFLEDLDISYPVNNFGMEEDEFEARSPGEVGVTDDGIELLSSKLKRLRKIDVSGNILLTDFSLVTLCTNCIYLTHIALCNLWSVTNHGIEFLMLNCPNLSSLLVQGIDFRQFDEHSLCCARNMSTLVIITSTVDEEFLHLLVKAGIPLESIQLDHLHFPTFTLSGISSLLNKYRSLKYLSLVQTPFLTDETMSDLSQCLSALVTIRLGVCDNLTESTFFTVAKNCPLLETISMEATNFGGGGGDRATEIVENPRIKSLNLERNQNLSDECLAKVASVCPNLEVLDVSRSNSVTQKGIDYFLKSGSKIWKLCTVECGGIENVANGFELSDLD